MQRISWNIYISRLRDIHSSRAHFRVAVERLSHALALEAYTFLPVKTQAITTPLGLAEGLNHEAADILLVPIMRSGMAMLPAFLTHFSSARVGIIGYKRDESTAIAHAYYANVPAITGNERIMILDPMIATGGTMLSAIQFLLDRGALQEQIIVIGIIGSKKGLQRIRATTPQVTVLCAAEDPHLNNDHFIVPGLGDFGDRFFGTE